MIGHGPEARLGDERLPLLRVDVPAVDRVRVGLLVVGCVGDPLAVGADELEERLNALDVLDHRERPARGGHHVEPGVLLSLAVALEDEGPAVGKDVGEGRPVLASRELDRKGVRSVEPPDLGRSGDGPAEVEPAPVGSGLAEARGADVHQRLDAAGQVGRKGLRRVRRDHLGRDALGTVALVGRLRGGGSGERERGEEDEGGGVSHVVSSKGNGPRGRPVDRGPECGSGLTGHFAAAASLPFRYLSNQRIVCPV